jgi:hypothetical protein
MCKNKNDELRTWFQEIENSPNSEFKHSIVRTLQGGFVDSVEKTIAEYEDMLKFAKESLASYKKQGWKSRVHRLSEQP